MEGYLTSVRPETVAMEFKEGGVPPSTPTPRSPSSPTDSKAIAMEIKRCEGVPWHKQPFKTQARMSTGGKGFLLAQERFSRAKQEIIIISDDDDEPTPNSINTTTTLRRSARLLGMKRKNYGKISPRPMDYGGDSDWEDDRSPGSWGKAGGTDDDEWPIVDEIHDDKEEDHGKGKQVKEESDDEGRKSKSVLRHANCCPRCREDIADLRATLGRALDELDDLNGSLAHLERHIEDDYKFLSRNVRKLFAMYGESRRQGGGARAPSCSCRK